MPVLALSGGLDSATLLAGYVDEKKTEILPVFFRYGSKHNAREEAAAERVAAWYGLGLYCVDLVPVFSSVQSALLAHDEREIPKEAYAAPSMGQTLVPGRNLVFASVLASLAESRGIPSVALATHSGDHHLYPDCRPSFNAALNAVLLESTGGAVRLETPFAALNKADIVALGLRLGVPYALTRSCYESAEEPCGLCGTCRERAAAFAANGSVDPAL